MKHLLLLLLLLPALGIAQNLNSIPAPQIRQTPEMRFTTQTQIDRINNLNLPTLQALRINTTRGESVVVNGRTYLKVTGSFSDNGGTRIVTQLGDRYLLQNEGVVSVDAFGANPNDDIDDTDAIVRAVNSDVSTLVFERPLDPGKGYRVSGLITFSNLNGKTLRGFGAVVKDADKVTGLFLFLACQNITIEGFDFKPGEVITGNGGGSQHVLWFKTCENVMVNKVHIYGSAEIGIATEDSYIVTIQNSVIENCWRDGTYTHGSAVVKYLANTYKNIKDDAASFHDYGHASEKTLISSKGFSQASKFEAAGNVITNAYQGIVSVQGANLNIHDNQIAFTVNAGIACFNKQTLYPDGDSRVDDVLIAGNTLDRVCMTTTIMGTSYMNFGQATTGRAAISILSTNESDVITLTPVKRSKNVKIRSNTVLSSGALGLVVYATDGLFLANHTVYNATVAGNTLGGNVVEIWEVTNFVQESICTILDTRTPIQHVNGYSFSGLVGQYDDWAVGGKTGVDGIIGNSPNLVKRNTTATYTTYADAVAATTGKAYTIQLIVLNDELNGLKVNGVYVKPVRYTYSPQYGLVEDYL